MSSAAYSSPEASPADIKTDRDTEIAAITRPSGRSNHLSVTHARTCGFKMESKRKIILHVPKELIRAEMNIPGQLPLFVSQSH